MCEMWQHAACYGIKTAKEEKRIRKEKKFKKFLCFRPECGGNRVYVDEGRVLHALVEANNPKGLAKALSCDEHDVDQIDTANDTKTPLLLACALV